MDLRSPRLLATDRRSVRLSRSLRSGLSEAGLAVGRSTPDDARSPHGRETVRIAVDGAGLTLEGRGLAGVHELFREVLDEFARR